MADRGIKLPKQSSTWAPMAQATSTAQNVQSFDEITIMAEQPATASPWVPRGTPKKGYSEDPNAAKKAIADGAPPKLLVELDDATNLRSDNQILTRETPTTPKSTKDARPNFKLRTYRDGET